MPRRRDAWTWGLVLGQLALLVVTFPNEALGTEVLGTEAWHHLASLGGVLLLAAALRRHLVVSRRFLAVGVLACSVLATVSGFYLLYWKEGIRIDGYQDWGVFWHIAWSWAFLVFFVMHTWINRVAYVHFFKQSLRRALPAFLHLGGHALVIAAFFVTWSPTGRTWFTNSNYLQLGFWAWLIVTVPAYLAWALVRRRGSSGDPWTVRRGVDLGLVPIAALAILSGIPLAFFDSLTDPVGLKYVSKYWHVWPSIVFAVLVFVHAVQAWPTVRAHWRRLGVVRGSKND